MNPLKQTKNEQLDNDFESYLNSDKYKKIKIVLYVLAVNIDVEQKIVTVLRDNLEIGKDSENKV